MAPFYLSYSFLLAFLSSIFALRWLYPVLFIREFWFGLLIIGAVSVFFRKFRIVTAAIIGTLIASLVVQKNLHFPHPGTLDFYAKEKKVELIGVISAEPDRRPLVHKYTINVESISNFSGTLINGITGKVLASDRRLYPRFNYGDRVRVTGKLEKPGQIEDFSYDNYLSRFGIYSVIYRADINLINSPKNSGIILKNLFRIKENFESQINKLYPEPHASFMAGLLTGSRKGIPEHLLNDFNLTGLTHIIAISGYNITIIIVIMSSLLFWLPLKWRFVPLITSIILFTIFVGASAAVVRASIMGILGLIALQVGRLNHVRLTILWTLFFMLAWNPKYLWYDAGFQLSFLAVIGLVEIAPLMEKLFNKIPQTLGIREAFMMTIAAQITAVPLIILLFKRLSLIAPLANVLIAPFVPLAMLFGFTGVLISYIYLPLGLLISYLGWTCLQWIILVAKYLSTFPFATVEVPELNTYLLIFYYLGLIYLITKRKVAPCLC